jgi:hypothetical protein
MIFVAELFSLMMSKNYCQYNFQFSGCVIAGRRMRNASSGGKNEEAEDCGFSGGLRAETTPENSLPGA